MFVLSSQPHSYPSELNFQLLRQAFFYKNTTVMSSQINNKTKKTFPIVSIEIVYSFDGLFNDLDSDKLFVVYHIYQVH